MADVLEKEGSGSTKIVGASISGAETNYVDATDNGAIHSNLRNNSGQEIGVTGSPLVTSTTNGATEITALNQLNKLQNIEDTTYPIKNNTDSMKDSLLLVRDTTQNLDTNFDSTLSSRASEATLSALNNKVHQNFGDGTNGIRTASSIADHEGVPFADTNPLPVLGINSLVPLKFSEVEITAVDGSNNPTTLS